MKPPGLCATVTVHAIQSPAVALTMTTVVCGQGSLAQRKRWCAVLKVICDYCSQQEGPGEDHIERIPLSRRPNGERRCVEICGYCLKEIAAYIDAARK